jgi:hypothetical protein
MKSFITVSKEEMTQVDGGMFLVALGAVAGVAGVAFAGWCLGAGIDAASRALRGR